MSELNSLSLIYVPGQMLVATPTHEPDHCAQTTAHRCHGNERCDEISENLGHSCAAKRVAWARYANRATIFPWSVTAHQVCGTPAHRPGGSTSRTPRSGVSGRRAAASTVEKGSTGSPRGSRECRRNRAICRTSYILNLRRRGTSGAVARERVLCPLVPTLSGTLYARVDHHTAAAARPSRGGRAGPYLLAERA